MQTIGFGDAPAKAILAGEHAVVYGYPAIAMPLLSLRAQAKARTTNSNDVIIEVPARNMRISLRQTPEQPLVKAVVLAMDKLGISAKGLQIRLDSAIPVASGLGSGAAVSTALIRAVADLHGVNWPPEQLSPLVYEIEKLHHGTPSGIDNSVIVYEQPLYFRKGSVPQFIGLPRPLHLVVLNTGIASATKEAVAALRQARRDIPEQIEPMLQQIGNLVEEAWHTLQTGDWPRLGRILDEDQVILSELSLSNAELDRLVSAARAAGALGAKLTGAGRGGHAIALATAETAENIVQACLDAGAISATVCVIG